MIIGIALFHGYTLQAAATGECPNSYACYATGYGYACQADASAEYILSYACYAIRYSYACQADATAECHTFYACYAAVIGNYTVFTACHKRFTCRFYKTIAGAVVDGISRLDGYAFQSVTTDKSIVTYGSYTARNGYVSQFNCGGKCDRRQGSNGPVIRNNTVFTAADKTFSRSFYQAVVLTVINRIVISYYYIFNIIRVPRKYRFTNICHST